MATATPHMRYIQLLLLLWFTHRTQTISVQPLVISSSLDDYLFTPTGWSAFHDKEFEKENSYSSEKERRGSTTNPGITHPSETVLRFLQTILDTRNSQHSSVSDELRYGLSQRLQSRVEEISNLMRTTSTQYRRRQRKNAKWVGFIRDNSARKSKWSQNDLEGVYMADPAGPIVSEHQFPTNHELPLPHHLPYQPQNSPSQQLSFDNVPSDQPRAERIPRLLQQQPPPDLPGARAAPRVTTLLPNMEFSSANLPPLPPWSGSELPPSMTVQVIDANFREIYEIMPSPNYHLLNLLTDLLSRPTHPLDIRVNKTGNCLFIENIDGLGQVDSTFEWRILVNNRQNEEIWNSQCMPPETLTLRFGYDVIFTYVMRYGLPDGLPGGHGGLSQDTVGAPDAEDLFSDLL